MHNAMPTEPQMLNVYISAADDPAVDLAYENTLLKTAGAGQSGLFLYQWSKPVLVLGRSQNRAEYARIEHEFEIPVYQRMSGGTGVLRDDDLGIALALNGAHPWAKSVVGLYAEYLSCISKALARFGVEVQPSEKGTAGTRTRSSVCFENQSLDGLMMGKKKVFGSAQVRKRGAVLVHGNLLLGLDVERQSRVFGVSEARISAAMASLEPAVGREALQMAIVEQMAAGLKLGYRLCPI